MAVERIATGFRWAEGPVYFPAGRYVLFSDIPNNRIMRLDEDDDHCNVFRQPSMNSNGNTIDREGRLITCEHSGRRVTRTELDGSITIIADSYNGKKLNSPNDVVVASDGSIWFTDPAYGIGGYYEGIKAAPEQEKHNVYRVDPKTGNIKVVVDDFVEPNGIAFSPDEKKLYIIDTGFTDGPLNPSHIRVFDADVENGKLSNSSVFAEMPKPEHYRWDACRPGWPGSGAPSAGAIRRKTASAATPRAANCSARSHSTGDGGQFVLWRPAAKPTIYMRLDVAVCSLHKCARRSEAVNQHHSSRLPDWGAGCDSAFGRSGRSLRQGWRHARAAGTQGKLAISRQPPVSATVASVLTGDRRIRDAVGGIWARHLDRRGSCRPVLRVRLSYPDGRDLPPGWQLIRVVADCSIA